MKLTSDVDNMLFSFTIRHKMNNNVRVLRDRPAGSLVVHLDAGTPQILKEPFITYPSFICTEETPFLNLYIQKVIKNLAASSKTCI